MIRHTFSLATICAALTTLPTCYTFAGEVKIGVHNFQLRDGFSIEHIAGPPLVDRPICGSFDELGRLYVADSSGSNEDVNAQLENPTHRIVRLEDVDGDGRFDTSTVFADRMMFPEGTQWYRGSLYVSAAPTIWKLTDTDDDGVADLREEWFQGKTLTHCANDLHGPYLGPDGWFYWCKGAFAEQTYERPDAEPFVTKAAHIFRCRPDAPRDPKTGSVLTSAIEPVMTGGMANPVDVTFTPGGERIFTTTFLIRPQAGLRDGLIHAIYGGVYGMNNEGRLVGHKRTGEIMPVLHHAGAAAPCGLTRYESNVFGDEFRDNLFACLFNMRKVTRHVLQPQGSTFTTTAEDFLVSDHLDFHPTDVIEDADGSLIVIDTGGWYKLCCPTSQLEKPDVLGAIYRVRRTGAVEVEDPRGSKIAWTDVTPSELITLLGDSRVAVGDRAVDELSLASMIDVLRQARRHEDAQTRRNAVWALTRIDGPAARSATAQFLSDEDPSVRQAAIHSASVHRDQAAVPLLIDLLKSDSRHNRRAAAEALGRIGDVSAVPALLKAAADPRVDRQLDHSLIYALIEINNPDAIRSTVPVSTSRAALAALDQMEGGGLQPGEVIRLLDDKNERLRETARWIVDRRPEWAEPMRPWLREQLLRVQATSNQPLVDQLARFAKRGPVERLLAECLTDESFAPAAQRVALAAMAQSGRKEMPRSWTLALSKLFAGSTKVIDDAADVIRTIPLPQHGADELVAALRRVGGDERRRITVRLDALAAINRSAGTLDAEQFAFVSHHIDGEEPVRVRAAAAEILAESQLNDQQTVRLAELLPAVSPLELNRLLAAFSGSKDAQTGRALIQSLAKSTARTALDLDTLPGRFAGFSESIQEDAGRLIAELRAETAQQHERLEQTLSSLPAGDVRRGQEVFHSTKAACSACHAIGYLGGRVGPDLTRIARVRSRRDLLEAVLFPSASLVQNYEPINVLTSDGTVHNGLIASESDDELVLTTGADKQVRISLDEIEQRIRSKVSIMPGGLDKQLTSQQLADLVEFLSTRK